jgi:hypothetical protein
MNKGGFSWKRFLGFSQAKARISRKIGIPLTRSGRQRKLGSAMGCILPLLILVVMIFFLSRGNSSCLMDRNGSSNIICTFVYFLIERKAPLHILTRNSDMGKIILG